MRKSTLLIAAAIIVSGVSGFFIGRAMPAKNTIDIKSTDKLAMHTSPSDVEKENKDTTTISASPPVESEMAEKGNRPENVVATNQPKAVEVKNNTPAPEPLPTNNHAGKAELERVNMGISDQKISLELEAIAKSLEAQKLEYIASKGQDCSGIFHRIKDSLQVRIPALSQNNNYQYPAFSSIRSSRQIADWYWKNNNLLIVEDAVASKNSIRPGSVLFFGKPNKRYSNMTIEQLTDKNNNYTSNGFIMHVAVVTTVKTDENNNVMEYTMMHGRNPGLPASRSGSKEVQSTRTPNLPPFGNWSQQLVAIANIATPKI